MNNNLPKWWLENWGIKPYYIGDCLIEMEKIPDKTIDLVLTDPPYGIDIDYSDEFKDNTEYINKIAPLIVKECKRISKVTFITCGFNNIHSYPRPDHILAWICSSGAFINSWGFSCWQPILAYGKDPFLGANLGGRPDIIMDSSTIKKFIEHPCPKPISLWIKLLLRGSIHKNDIIFDPFLGSGTTLLACRKTNRIGIGFEIEKRFETTIIEQSMLNIPDITIYNVGEIIGETS